MALHCPVAVQAAFPDRFAPPFGPAVADPAGVPASGQRWFTKWTCGFPIDFWKHSLSNFPATPLAFERVLFQHLLPLLEHPPQQRRQPFRLPQLGPTHRRTHPCHRRRCRRRCRRRPRWPWLTVLPWARPCGSNQPPLFLLPPSCTSRVTCCPFHQGCPIHSLPSTWWLMSADTAFLATVASIRANPTFITTHDPSGRQTPLGCLAP
jgi:hypothetical protein